VLAELVSIASRDLEVKCDNEFPWLQIGNNLEPFKISQNSAFKRGSARSVQVRIGVRSGGMDVLPSLPATPSNGARRGRLARAEWSGSTSGQVRVQLLGRGSICSGTLLISSLKRGPHLRLLPHPSALRKALTPSAGPWGVAR
jgi:hypothetical protein